MISSTEYVLNCVRDTIEKHGMFTDDRGALVAVSGGADSVCLLHALNSLKKELKIKLYAAHLNHCIRGEDADSDEKYVKELCDSLNIKSFFKRVEVGKLANEDKITVEEAGRRERYKFFNEVCKDLGICTIATAHNKNDQAETILMRIMRGTGLDGLTGIKYVREDNVIRPILDVGREHIERYCEENRLKYCTDKTNFENEYTRNKIRNELIPFIEKNFNSSIIDSLANLSSNISEDAEFLNSYANRLYERVNNPMPQKKPYVLHIESLKMVGKSILVRLIKMAASRTVPNVRLEKKHIDDILSLLDKNTGVGIDLPIGLRCEVQYGWLVFKNTIEDKNERVKNNFFNDFYTCVDIEKSYSLEPIGKTVSFKLVDPRGYKLNSKEFILDFGKIENKRISVRNRRDGDKIVWFKDGRSKRLKNLFIDMKIPKEDRDRIPLLCVDDDIAVILGIKASEKYKVENMTEKALVIIYE